MHGETPHFRYGGWYADLDTIWLRSLKAVDPDVDVISTDGFIPKIHREETDKHGERGRLLFYILSIVISHNLHCLLLLRQPCGWHQCLERPVPLPPVRVGLSPPRHPRLRGPLPPQPLDQRWGCHHDAGAQGRLRNYTGGQEGTAHG